LSLKLPPWFALLAVAATATIAAAAKAAASATTAAAEAATAATTAAIFARFGFVNIQGSAINFLAIELRNSSCAFLFGGHFDEAEASRTACVAVFDDRC
jgi:histidinol-phosphate/aromatic aminotransferase/cobyric acid decarboxylase-like protein